MRGRANYPPSDWLVGPDWTVPVLVDDADGTAAAAWGLRTYPYFVAVAADGTVVKRASGELTEAEFYGLVDAARARTDGSQELNTALACLEWCGASKRTTTLRRLTMANAIITGGSRGLGLALARRLSADGWGVVIDGRHAEVLQAAAAELGPGPVEAIAGDVTDARHRAALVEAAGRLGGLDLLVNNASTLGPDPAAAARPPRSGRPRARSSWSTSWRRWP